MAHIDMGSMHVRSHTSLRDDQTGQFIAALNRGAHRAAEQMADRLAAYAIRFAKERTRRRTGALIAGINWGMTSATQGFAVSAAPEALPLEDGAAPHDIPNSFGWGHDFGFGSDRKPPAAFFHPGNKAFHIMRDAGLQIAKESPTIVARYMPR